MALDFPNAPSPGEVFDNWEWDGSKWIPAPGAAWQTPLVFFFPGIPAAGFMIPIPITIPLTVPANFAGSWSNVTAAPAANAVFEVNTASAGNVGTITLQPGAAPIWSTAGFSMQPNDTIWVEAPTAQDTTLSGPAFTILAMRG